MVTDYLGVEEVRKSDKLKLIHVSALHWGG